jgi:hypothetical protein
MVLSDGKEDSVKEDKAGKVSAHEARAEMGRHKEVRAQAREDSKDSGHQEKVAQEQDQGLIVPRGVREAVGRFSISLISKKNLFLQSAPLSSGSAVCKHSNL